MPLFTQELSPTENYVYHYTSLEVAIEHILSEGKLRFSPFIQTNDPRETKDWMVNISIPTDTDFTNEQLNEMTEKFNNELKRNIKVLSMTVDDRGAHEYYPVDYWHRGFAHSRMWAQYASNHRGICLVFDQKDLHHSIITELNDLNQIHFGHVNYTSFDLADIDTFRIKFEDVKNKGIENVLNNHLNQYFQTLYLRKSSDWRDEYEFRWITKSSNLYEYISIENSLKAIILGAETPIIYNSVFKEFQNKYKIDIARMHWVNGNPSIVPAF